jgi:hypothetical protein
MRFLSEDFRQVPIAGGSSNRNCRGERDGRSAQQQRIDELRSALCLSSSPQREPEVKPAEALHHKLNRDQST